MFRRDFCKFGVAGVGALAFFKNVSALDYLAAAAKKKYAIIYYSWCGSTKDAATWINEGMGGVADILDEKDSPKVSDYESIILGSAVRAAAISPDIKTYITTNKTALQGKIKGLFAVCGNNGNPVTDALKKKYIDDQLANYSSASSSVPSKLFPGRSKDGCGGVSAIYDNLKKEDCVAFGKTILPTLVKSIPNEIPTDFELRQNFPNPFHPVTNISYSLPQTCSVLLTVTALNGRKLATIVSGQQEAGYHHVIWDGRQLPPGRYLYRLQAGSFSAKREARIVH